MADGKGSPLRHPLTIVVVGFLLTGVAGTLLSDFLTSQRAEQQRAAEVRETRREAVQDLAQLIYGRRTRAALLASAIRRNADGQEIRERKTLYDASYVAWGSELQANLFLIRSVVEAQSYSRFESYVEFRLVPLFRELDRCITRAYDSMLRNDSGRDVLEDCEDRMLLQTTLDCSYAITDQLFRLAEAMSSVSEESRDSLLLMSERAVGSNCPPQ